jgi:hypothetical protein
MNDERHGHNVKYHMKSVWCMVIVWENWLIRVKPVVVIVSVNTRTILLTSQLCIINSTSKNTKRYLVDPASSHMLVLKIKPCMSKYKHVVL